MRMTAVLTQIAITGVIAGGLLATPAGHATRAAVTPLSHTAIIVGGTTQTTPSATLAQTAAELFLKPLGFDVDGNSAVCVIGTDACDAPLQVLTTPALVQQGHSSFAAAAEIVRAVEAHFAADSDTYDAENPLFVFGYSQGATAVTIAMSQLAHNGIDSDAVHFVTIGDPYTPNGILSHLEPALESLVGPQLAPGIIKFFDYFIDFMMLPELDKTPADLFPATVYTLDNDVIGDFTGAFGQGGLWGALQGYLVNHVEYLGLTPEQIADATTTVDGDVTYVNISGDIDHSAAWLNAVDHGMFDSGLWESLYNTAVAFAYNLFGGMEQFFTDWLGIDWGGVEETLNVWF
ncbi:hypothetical protein AWC24_01365 [Mycolicibacter senuensis]|nr:hypothetical protein AWC24_01365 [Mycolicibacter senuensis]